jgi:hypothetical protein
VRDISRNRHQGRDVASLVQLLIDLRKRARRNDGNENTFKHEDHHIRWPLRFFCRPRALRTSHRGKPKPWQALVQK